MSLDNKTEIRRGENSSCNYVSQTPEIMILALVRVLLVCLCYLSTSHRFIIERHHHAMSVGSPGAECYIEPGSSEGLHPGGNVIAGAGRHEDLQVPLPGLSCVN